MIFEEWKHYRNITVKAMDKVSDKILAKTLGIDYNLAIDIRNGVYDWQIKEWNRIKKRQSKEPKESKEPIFLIDDNIIRRN